MSLRVRPYFVNRLWTRCAASVGASFARDVHGVKSDVLAYLTSVGASCARDIGQTVASKARSYRRKKTVNAKNFTYPSNRAI